MKPEEVADRFRKLVEAANSPEKLIEMLREFVAAADDRLRPELRKTMLRIMAERLYLMTRL